MTTRWPYLVVTAFCSLLAVATSAAAECAWALWYGGTTPPVEWIASDAFSSRKECGQALAKDVQTLTKDGQYSVPSERLAQIAAGSVTSVSLFMEKDPSRSVALKCLPDTVDPRGPKGGK